MDKKKIFNEFGTEDVIDRKIIGGNSTNMFNLNNIKYNWANKLYRVMMENFWIPEKLDITDDVVSYTKLTTEEKTAYDGILSFLVFLDSIQTNNLPTITDYITAPEVSLVLTIQTFQEAVHSASYAYIIESIIPKDTRDTLYEKWREDEILLERNKYIAQIYQEFRDSTTEQNFGKVLIANFLLESLYFYNGFNFFYLLTSRNLMNGTSDVIKLINKDEASHIVLFEQIIKEVRRTNPKLISDDEIYAMFEIAVEQEIKWSQHIIHNVLGMSDDSIEKYTKWLANERLMVLDLKPIYDINVYNKNPYEHLDVIADVGGGGNVKANFFESTVTSYNMSSAVRGWDEF